MNCRPSVRTETIKLSWENIGANLHELGLDDTFLSMPTLLKAEVTNEPLGQLAFVEMSVNRWTETSNAGHTHQGI